MSNRERARRAIDTMNALGFSKKEATPVLRNLLKLFDHSWEPIEDDGYRALADAILDSRDRPQGPEHGGHHGKMVALEEDHQQPSTSLAVHGGPCDSDNETGAPHKKRPRTISNNFSADHSIDSQLSLSSSVTAHERAKQMMDEDFQDAVFLREPKPEPDMDVAQNFHDAQVGIVSHPFNTSSSGAADPLASLPPDQNQSGISGNKGKPIQHHRTRTSSTSFVEPTNSMAQQPQNRESSFSHTAVMHNTGTGSANGYTQEAPFLHTVVASSAMGEVKMSIKCSIDPSKFRMPSLEAVFRMVEDKCLRSYKILPPNFSIGSLMNEICQCVAQLENDHTLKCNTQSDSFVNCRNLQKKSMLSDGAFVEPIALSTGGGNYNSVEESLETSENGQGNSAVAQHQALSQIRCSHYTSDISKGEEKVRISVVNEFGSEKCPPSFYYIQRNLVSEKAYANISATRIGDENGCANCSGNCLSAPVPCACARETGGEFAYTPDSLVRTAFIDECVSASLFPEKHYKFFNKHYPLERSRNEAPPEPCRGHHVRKFIKECWSKCGCNIQCGNRVVQRGIACNLQVFYTGEGTGWGLRALDELQKGAFICEYVGELLTNTELLERTYQNNARYTYPVDLDADWASEGVLKDEEALCLDATFYGNVGRFINHRCYDANLIEIPVEVETPDHPYYHLALFTSKKVEAFEELTWDYGIDFNGGRPFECLCGSRYCRGKKHRKNRGKAAAKQAAVEGTSR